MKRKSFRFTLLASAMLAAMTLTSCTAVDDNPVDNPTTTEGEDRDVDSFVADAAGPTSLDLFLANFFITGEDGKKQLTRIGTVLDEADPTVLSIPAESLEQADQIFRNLVSREDLLTSTGTGNIVYTPTDAQGNKLGEIRLTPADDCIAHITWSEGLLPDDLISEVRFVDRQLWPNNDGNPFAARTVKVGHYYKFVESGDDRPNYLLEVPEDGPWTYLCIEVNELVALFFEPRSSRPYSYDTDKKDVNGTYGIWYTDVKGKGTPKYSMINKKAGSWHYYGYSLDGKYIDTRAEHLLPREDELWDVYKAVQKNKNVKTIKDLLWNDIYEGKMFWAGRHTEVSRHFHFDGYVLTKEGEEYGTSYRAYTNLGMFSTVIKTYSDMTVKTVQDYGTELHPDLYKEYEDYNHFFTEDCHYKTSLFLVDYPYYN